MQYRKIKVSSLICPRRFYRVMYIDDSQTLYEIGIEILTALQAEFEHMFYFEDTLRSYVDEEWLENFGYSETDVDYKHYFLDDVILTADNTFLLEYDTGDSWDFGIKVYKTKKEIDSNAPAIIIDAKGDRIWEDYRYYFEKYISNIPFDDYDFDGEEIRPWNIPDGRMESFDEPVDIDHLNELLKNRRLLLGPSKFLRKTY